MFEDGWPIQLDSWYDEDFNDVVFEYDLKAVSYTHLDHPHSSGDKAYILYKEFLYHCCHIVF